mgnify:CR=1 FL=1
MDKSSVGTINSLRVLWSYLSRKRKSQINLLLVFMLLSALAELTSIGSVIPLLTVVTNPEKVWNIEFLQSIYKFWGFKNPSDLLFPITLIFGLTCLLSASVKIINSWLSGKVAAFIGSDLSYVCYKNTLLQPYEIHIERNTSSIVSSLINQLDRTVKAINTALIFFTGVIISSFLLITLIYLNWLVAFLTIFFLGSIYLLIAFLTKKKLSINSQLVIVSDQGRIKSLQEGLGAIREVIMGRTQSIYLKNYLESDKPIRQYLAQNTFISTFPRYAIEAAALILMTIFIYFLASRRANYESFLPLLGSIILCSQKLLPSLQSVYSSWAALRGFGESILEVIKIIDQPIGENLEINDSVLETKFESLCLNSVAFTYKNAQKVTLSNINLKINKGESIGIVGTTGSGKSTLMDILMGLLKPSDGEILINGKSLYKKDNRNLLNKWRKSISHVPQNIFLSDSSILENIAFGDALEEIDVERVKICAEKAQLSNFIESCPNGLKTVVGERGVKLSGGQRQRIGIARALYKKSQVLFLDEATSALDIYTERKLMKELRKMPEDLTIIIIAHRLTTLKNCEKVLKVEKGKIVFNR